MPSKALEVNIAYSRVDVTVDKRYEILQEVMGEYHGVRERLQTFLEEICHPYKNWKFIVKEAKGYALNYFHVLLTHPKGPEAARLYIDIFFQAIDSSREEKLRISASDNLLSFIQKVIKDAGTDLFRFLPVLDYAFGRIRHYPKKTFVLFVKSFYQLNRLGRSYSQAVPSGSGFTAINHLLIKYFRYTYDYWLEQVDPLVWFEKESGKAGLDKIFKPISHKHLKACQERLESIVRISDDRSKTILDQIVELPGYGQILTIYSEIPQELLNAGDDKAQGNHWKLLFLLRIMDTTGLSPIHEETLRDINRTLAWLIYHEDPLAVQQSLKKTCAILRRSTEKFPVTALNCILNIGRGVYKTEESELVEFFIDSVVSLGFQTPEIKGVGEDWQIRANPAHIQNIRTWIQLIEMNPKWSKKLLSSLIIHLSLSDVLIKDTDLFPRDITQLLNSDIGPVYNLVKQLTRLFPAYFNDIGAEGRLRDISTEIDEIYLRKDPLIHFLRKQSHVESSNQLIGLMEAVLNFWKTRNKENIRPFVPTDIYEQVETEGPNVDGVHKIVTHLFQAEGLSNVADLLNIEDDRFKTLMGEIPGISNLDFKKIELGITFYKLLYQKYHLEFTEINGYLAQLRSSGLPDPEKLEKALGEKNAGLKLELLLSYLEKLREIILSSE
ncbi:MAG: pyruvate, phosphate dikinase, partial [Thermodesulfobacteriota bacterium]|nr:pyruvate, phosphate dikinase [Thermodesulfobacteriota bacterium]